MQYSRDDLKNFIKGVLNEKKETFLLHENEDPCWGSIMNTMHHLQKENPAAFSALVTALSDAYAIHSPEGKHTSDCEPEWGTARWMLRGKGRRHQVDPAAVMAPKPPSEHYPPTPARRVTKIAEHYDYPEGGTTVRGTPEYLPGEEPINVGKDIVADDAAAKILSSVDAVIELDVEEYEAQGYSHEEALQLAREDAAQTLEIVLNDLDNN